MAGRFVEHLGLPVNVVTAGTHVVENQPMSRRTRAAFLEVGVDPGHHRSHQLTDEDVETADLIVAMAAEHVQFVRRNHVAGAGRTATIEYLAGHLAPGPLPLADRVAALSLAEVPLDAQGDVPDPAGEEEPVYIACAVMLTGLVDTLVPGLTN